MKPTLQELIHKLWNAPENAEWTPKAEFIRLDELRSWMQSDDIEVLGFVAETIFCGKFRIEPPLPREEHIDFRRRYLERCFLENPNGDWADSRYSAGSDLLGLIVELWQADAKGPALTDLKRWLARLYKDGDDGLRMCIVNATLEHLPRPVLRKLFSDWKSDPELRQAYELASFNTEGD